jgi:hypothetical protein
MTGPRTPRTDVVDPNVAPLHEHPTINSKRAMKHPSPGRVEAGTGDGEDWVGPVGLATAGSVDFGRV